MNNLSQKQFTPSNDILQALLTNGTESFAEILTILLNEAMKIERSNYLQANSYQRSNERIGYANGYKDKTLHSRVGDLNLSIPQTRESGFYPSCLEQGIRSEKALLSAMMEMYIQGVSTRKINNILKELCNLEVSPSQVSRVTKLLDTEVDLWRNRPLSKYDFLLVDARYEKIRIDHSVRDCAVLIAYGIDPTGKRSVLGVSVELSEAEIHWRKFFESLVQRGLHGVQMVISDSHFGLKQARKAVFPSVPWQRCQFHLQQNASAHIPKKSMENEVHANIKMIFNAPNLAEAERLLRLTVQSYSDKSPELASWLEENVPESLTVFKFKSLTDGQRKRLRTTNMIEFQNKELKKRTRCVKLFPNKESLLRLVGSLLMELDEKWQTDSKAYLRIDNKES